MVTSDTGESPEHLQMRHMESVLYSSVRATHALTKVRAASVGDGTGGWVVATGCVGGWVGGWVGGCGY
jgi:hypothetical protein